MILIITHKTDYTADFVINKLNQKGIDYYRLNCEDVFLKNNISIEFNDEVITQIGENQNFNSAWFRRVKFPDLKEYENDVKEFCYRELDSFFKNLWCVVKTDRWLSKPDNVYNAENKLLQLKKAKEIGLNIPETIVTGNAKRIKEFYDLHGQNIIVKPIHENRVISAGFQRYIFTNKLQEVDFNKIEDRIPLPSLFQKYVTKHIEYRVTVVNEDVFVASVDSQSDEETKIDWRKKKLKFKSAHLPSNLKNQCVELTRSLGISFGAIDLIEDPEGNFHFLEINPNGQWAWVEMDTGLPISESIVEYLSNTVNHEIL